MRTVQFEATDEAGKPVLVVVRPPSPVVVDRAEQVYQREVRRAVSRGRPTTAEVQPLIDAAWDDDRQARYADIQKAIDADAAIVNSGLLELDERRFAAHRITRARADMKALRAAFEELHANTAERAGMTAMFDYVAAACTRYIGGRRVFATTTEFVAARERSDPVATRACWVVAEALLGLRQNFEETLPENVFLREHSSADAA